MLFSLVVVLLALNKGFNFFTSLPMFVFFFFFGSSDSNGCKVRFVFYLTKSLSINIFEHLLCSKHLGIMQGGWRREGTTTLGFTVKACALQRPGGRGTQRVEDGVRDCEAPSHVHSEEGTS